MTITAAQIRGARGMLKMLQGDLASAAGLTPAAMNAIEAGTSKPRAATTDRLRAALEQRGIVFFESHEGRGVMLKGDA